MGEALDRSESVQRMALTDAHAAVRVALEAPQPFVAHAGRLLPGIERAVAAERDALTEAASHLLTIVAEHLDHVDEPLDDAITQTVDRAHEARVLALTPEARAS